MTRREFQILFGGLAAGGALFAQDGEGYITDVDGVKVGHFTDKRRPTGCTVILFEKGAVGGVDVRGSAPGTRETDLLNPVNTVQRVNAVVLSGGSAYGLETATGVMRYCEEKGWGVPVAGGVVPIVPAAILMDLGVGDRRIRPNAEAGYQAAAAAAGGKFDEGTIGAGAGATVGKMFGPGTSMKGGLGTSSIKVGNTGIVVGALVAVNAVGDVIDPKSGKILAGARKKDGSGFEDAMARTREGHRVEMPAGRNTTIGIVATNAAFDKAQVTKIAQMAHDGLARSINPIHTPGDGDTIFAVATGTTAVRANHGAIGSLAAEAMAEAVVRAIKKAKGLPGIPSYSDLQK